MSKKIYKMDSVEDIEILYQKFVKKMTKDFRAGKPAGQEELDSVTKWMFKKTGLNTIETDVIVKEFLTVMLKDPSVDGLQERKQNKAGDDTEESSS